MQLMQMFKTILKPRNSVIASVLMVALVASVMVLAPTNSASNTLAQDCPNAPTTPTFNYWPVTYDDVNTPFCHDFPAIDAAIDTNNPQWSTSQADWDNGLNMTVGQQGAAGLYIHNGAANNLPLSQTTAKNVHIITQTDTTPGTSHQIKVTYTADNAAPYTRSFTVHTPENSKLEVIPNTGFMYDYQGRVVLDQQNLNLGNSDYFLGDLDACFEYSLFLTYKFKVVPATPTPTNTTLSIEKKVKNLTVDPNTGRGATYYETVNAKQNEQVGYRIQVTNTGTSVAQNVTVTDPGVAGVTVDAGSTAVRLADDISLPNGWSGSIPGTVNIGDLLPGESRLVTYSGRVTVQSGTLVNTAKAIATNAPQVQDNATVIVTYVNPGTPGLSISKLVKNNNNNTAYADSVGANTGQWVRFKVTITNTGTANLTNAVVTDAIPAGLQFENTATATDGTISFTNGTLRVVFNGAIAPNQTRTIEFNAQVVAVGPTTICNVASATATNVGQVQDDACVNVAPPVVVGNPGLTITKLVKNNNNNTAYADTVNAKTNEWVNFKINITNNGTADLSNARITDAIPAGLEFENSVVAQDGTVSFANNTLTVTYNGVIPAGHTRTVEFAAQVKAVGPTTICNVASATGNNVAPVQADACVNVAAPIIIGTPNLAIQKLVKNNNNNTAYADVVDAKTGEWVRFKVTITNTGNAELTGATIVDTLPSGLEFENTAIVDNGSVNFANSRITVTFPGAIAAGQSRTLEFNAQVRATGNTTLCNVALAYGNAVSQVQDDACVRITGTPNLTIQKLVKNNNQNTAFADSVSAKTGEWVKFKINITNTGNADLVNARITDAIPAGLEFENSVVTDGVVAFANNTLTVTFNSPVTPGQSKTVEFVAQVKATTTTTICNTAVGTGNNVAQVQDNACVYVVGAPNLTITKQVKNGFLSFYSDSTDAKTNDKVNFKIVITNTGTGELTGARITDAIPAGLEYADSLSTDGTGTFSNGTLTVVFNSALAAGQSKTVEFAAKVTATGNATVCNIAVATGNSVSQVQADACVRVTGTPNLAIQKWVKTGGAYADTVDAKTNERVTFKISITNTGNADLTGARITDVIPNGFEYADSVVTDGTHTFANNTLTVVFNSALSAGQSKTVEFAANVKATGPTTVCNVAKATGNNVIEVSDDACVKVMAPPVVTNPKIAIKKYVKNISTTGNYEDSTVDVRTGERAGFKITVTNTGDTTLNNVKVTDVIPTGLEYDANVTGAGTASFSGSTFTVDFGSMTAGQTKTVEFATKVLTTGNTTICNVAKVNATGVSEVQDDACVKIYTTPKPGDPKIELSKKAFNDTKGVDATTVAAVRGDYITYTLITKNSGTADKTDYVISDDLSQVLSLVDMVSLNGGTLSGNMLSFPAMTIKAGETVTKTFKVRIKQTLSADLSYQLKNTYGNTVVIDVPGKVVYQAPTTGAAGTSAVAFAGLLTAGFVAFRKRESILKLLWN